MIGKLRLIGAFFQSKLHAVARYVLRHELKALRRELNVTREDRARMRTDLAAARATISVLNHDLNRAKDQVIHKEWGRLRDDITALVMKSEEVSELFHFAKLEATSIVSQKLRRLHAEGMRELVGAIISQRAEISVHKNAGEFDTVTLTVGLKDRISIPMAIDPIDRDLVRDLRNDFT